MKRSSLRAFGIACFLIGSSYVIIDKFFESDNRDETTINKYEKQIEQLEQQLADAKEQIEQLQSSQQAVQNKEKQNDKEIPTNDKESNSSEQKPKANVETNNDVVHATLHIYSGLTGYEIGKKLEDLGIVKNSVEMELYLAKPEYAKSIQIGQFELNSEMSIKEIADIITGKKNDAS